MEMIESFVGSCVLGKKMDALKRKFRYLESKKDDIEEEFKDEKSLFMKKKPRREVEIWLMNVENVKHEVRKLEQQVTESNLFKRLRLEKSVNNLKTEVTELVEQAKFPRGLRIEASKEEGISLLTKRLVGEKFQQNKDKIWHCLNNVEDSIIGVYGMGGAGKTTLLMHIHNQLLTHQGFEVAWVTVSQNFSIRGLQRAIAKTVPVDISDEHDEKKRAAKLAMALKKRKKFILILDDVWEHINLDQVGIAVGEDGRKLILTSRSASVCRMTNCEAMIKVEPLSPREAWTLFVETLGNENSLSHRIKEMARSLVKECAGLPLAIIIAAGSMRGVDDIDEWRDALEEIKGAENWHDEMEFFEVFRVLKYSYDKLKDSKLQECLLYCSLFPEDAEIAKDRLIEYFIMEKLVDGRKCRRSMFHKGHAMLKKLESVCLLEGHEGFVKMHDLVRDMAIKIASDKSPFLVKAGMRLTNIPDEEEWSEDLVRVSLMQNHICDIPFDASPRCPRLSTLLLCKNYHLNLIPDNFFTNMISLGVLDLSYTSIESLPTSISNLESLTSLLLGNCRSLSHLPSLANLSSLRKLDLNDTGLKEIPHGMEKLVNIRSLSLDRCLIKQISSRILSKLSHIKHLSASTTWLRGEERWSMRNLETFRGRFCDIHELNTCFGPRKRRERNKVYKFQVTHLEGSFSVILDLTSDDKQENAEDISPEIRVSNEPPVFPTGIETLLLDGHESLHNSCDISSVNKISHGLRIPKTDRCDKACYCSIIFGQSLECIKILGSQKAMEIIARDRNPLSATVTPTHSFSSLKQFQISECHYLKTLFTPGLLRNLKNLEMLEVKRCKQLVEIIGESSPDEDEDEYEDEITRVIQGLPKLKSMRLYALQNLKSICSLSIRVPDSLEEIAIMYCWELKKMTLLREEENNHSCLRKVYVENDCWDLMEWKHPETKAVLQPYLDFVRPSFFY